MAIPGYPGAPVGSQGAQGLASLPAAGFRYTADTTSQAASDPGAGVVKWNNLDQSLATLLYIDHLDKSGTENAAVRASVAGQTLVTFAGVAKTFQMQFITGNTGDTAAVSYARMDIFRVS